MSTTKVSGGTPVVGSDVPRVTTAKGRATPKGPSFGSVMAGARPILKGAEAVASVLPGGPLVSAAIKGPTTVAMSGPGYGGGPGYASAKPGGVPIAPRIPVAGSAPIGGAPDPVAAAAGTTDPNGASIEGVLQDSQAFNLYFLQLQEQISAENRQYTALSNVLKARHDTVKNAIGNIR
jgi:hypothetical protein